MLLGRLTLYALKHDWIEYMAGVFMFGGAFALVALLTYKKKWTWLWKEWLTSVDHKKIGIMYIFFATAQFAKGFIDVMMMRMQLAVAAGDNMGYLGAEHYQQVFTAHGVSMIFFVIMGFLFGIINLLLPMQIGARDVAFPFLNNLSFWLFVSGGMYIFLSLVVGSFAGTGWTAYPPLSGLVFNPGVGVDYYLWTLQISGVGTLLSGINFLVTIFKMRCPGMKMMKMPIFVWSVLATVILVVMAFPILTATLGMLSTDRLLDTKIFTAGFGGVPMLYVNLIWAWGHPEVYILILVAFGMFSEIVPVFSQKKLFGYTSMVWAIGAIAFLAFIVWLHHFFTMGSGASVNAFFGIMTMIIAVPTGVKVFNWIFTMYRGRVIFKTPMLWFLGFIFFFVTGGMAGVMMAVPGIDFQVHNSLFLVAHFHFVIVGGALFGFFAGYTYWFPKFTGFKLDEKIGRYAFGCWVVGFFLAFAPLYILGFMGATRRLNQYPAETGWQPLFVVAAIGASIAGIGLFLLFYQLYKSIKNREQLRDKTGDPWNGSSLEWSTKSPPPFYNYARVPQVHSRDPFWQYKKRGVKIFEGGYQDFHMPSNTPYGLYIGLVSFAFGFALVWHIFWAAALSTIGMFACIVLRMYQKNPEYTLSAETVKKIENIKD